MLGPCRDYPREREKDDDRSEAVEVASGCEHEIGFMIA
jgi:hypothetical protein